MKFYEIIKYIYFYFDLNLYSFIVSVVFNYRCKIKFYL